MIKVEKSVIIKKPVEKVFAYAQDMQNFPKWQGQGSMEMLEGSYNIVGFKKKGRTHEKNSKHSNR